MNDILEGYAAEASSSLVARFESVDPKNVYAPVIDLLPKSPARVADIGAGTGRDAAWFAHQGHDVVAAEPVRELREPGMAIHRDQKITWLDDRLPDLSKLQVHGPFDLVTLCGVWQHIDDEERQLAMQNLGRLVKIGGLLIMSLRHGPGAPGRRVVPVKPSDTIELAERAGFNLLRQLQADAIQPDNRAAGVHWTWLALKKAE
ncbi:class I SAM-dependent methyltransferase [Mesorhizobium sp. M0114]|uniref:class I SAM-dependent methyltransferase n=1 Tax=unclassified Mesorhizobium TaxID=325217 RepID=UPI003339FBD1